MCLVPGPLSLVPRQSVSHANLTHLTSSSNAYAYAYAYTVTRTAYDSHRGFDFVTNLPSLFRPAHSPPVIFDVESLNLADFMLEEHDNIPNCLLSIT